MNNHTLTMIHHMAGRAGIAVTDTHLAALGYAYDYYRKNRVGPLYGNIEKSTGVSKDDITTLFPYGLNSLYTWVGIPVHRPDHPCKPMATIDVDDYREVYLDHNATTYLRPEVRDLLVDLYSSGSGYGNPSSSTGPGIRSHDIVATARKQLADCLAVSPEEILFVGCGTEANNLAIKGIASKHLGKPGHIISSSLEHPSVMETMEHLEGLGFDVTYIGCNADGLTQPKDVQAALRPDTILVCAMAVNNEIGTVNPVGEIGAICKVAGVPYFADCVQAFGKIPLRPKELGISMASISGHKIYAPKGVGALYVDRSLQLAPQLHGGGQEHGVRSGTENVELIAAFGHAAHLIHKDRARENERLTTLRNYFLEKLREIEPDLAVNGSLDRRIPHNLNVGFPGIDSGSLLLSLNQIGVYVSAGSACHAGSDEDSHVIRALRASNPSENGTSNGSENNRANPEPTPGAIRFSFGLRTQPEDLDYLLKYLAEILEKLRAEVAAA